MPPCKHPAGKSLRWRYSKAITTVCVLCILWHHQKYARYVNRYILCSEGFRSSDSYGTTTESWNNRWRKQQDGKNTIAKGRSGSYVTPCADTMFPNIYNICRVFIMIVKSLVYHDLGSKPGNGKGVYKTIN